MTDKRISELDAITGANTAATDVFVVVDTSTGQTKKITREELNNAIEQDVLSSIDIDTINGDFSVNGNINLGDNNKAIFGAGSDLQIYHDGSNSYIGDAGTGSLIIEGTDLNLRATDNSRYLVGVDGSSGYTALYHPNGDSQKLATTATGILVSGNTESDTVTIGVSSVAGSEKLRVNGTVLTLGGSVSIPAIGIGDVNTGVYAPTAGELGWTVNGVQRLLLDSTGIDVTGTVTADDFYVRAGGHIEFDFNGVSAPFTGVNSPHIFAGTGGSGSYLAGTLNLQSRPSIDRNIQFITGATPAIRMAIGGNGDIYLGYENTGTTPKLFWDASAEALKIDTDGTGFAIDSSSNAYMVIDRSASNRRGELVFSTASTNVLNAPPLSASTDWALGVSDSDELAGDAFYISTQSGATAAKMVITRSGDVGIGTSSPDAPLTVKGETLVQEASPDGNSAIRVQYGTDGNTALRDRARLMSVGYDGVLELIDDTNVLTAKINSNGTSYLNGGNVGIGTTAPASALHIVNSGLATQLRISNTTADATIKYGTVLGSHYTNSEEPIAGMLLTSSSSSTGGTVSIGGGISSANAVNNIVFYTAANNTTLLGSERLRIDSAGLVGIGESNPDGLLHLTGDTNSNGAELYLQVNNNNTTDNLGAIHFGNNVDTTLSRILGGTSGANNSSYLTFSTSSAGSQSERMRIDSSGRLGLGTSPPSDYWGAGDNTALFTPLGYLGSNGNFAVSLYSNGYRNSSGGFAYLGINGNTSTASGIDLHPDATIIFRAGTASGTALPERARLDASGNFMVGGTISNPAFSNTSGAISLRGVVGTIEASRDGGSALELNRKTSDGAIINLRKDGTTAGHISTVSGSMYLGTASNAIRFTSTDIRPVNVNGDNTTNTVDLGDSASRFKDLHLGGTAYISGGSNQITLDTGDQTTYGRLDVGHFSNGTFIGTYAGTNAAANVMRFGTSGTERMRIDSSGNVLVGTTTSAMTTGGTMLAGGSVGYLIQSHASGVGSGEWYSIFKYGTSVIGSITQSGTTAVLFNTSSDQRLKENIADADDAGNKVDAIQVRQFDWKADGSHQDYGMIAQELQAVAPEAVSGDADSEEMMGVDYSKLVPMLIKEIQSLRNRVSQLEGN